MKRIDFEKHLKRNDCLNYREGGNHSIWVNKMNNKHTSIPRHNELSNITCKLICKQLEIPQPDKF
ncbi:MAG: type II toxin-antitoxin system HicA family toxin [Bacteroidota bacterium]